ncbi:Digestive organ expansion factor-like protein [Dirofilaria immitis]|nr:Digestive organ expansion factor-like protein [Dirofilaria immitis]
MMIKGKRKFREAFGINENNIPSYFQQHFEEILDPAIVATLLTSTTSIKSEPKRIVLEDIGIGLFQQRYSKFEDDSLKQEGIEHFGTLTESDIEKTRDQGLSRPKVLIICPMKKNVSNDYRKLMSGNTDDCFRIGVALAKKSLQLYKAFDESDILIASPLGLRMIADILLMQNWEHLLNIINSLHIQPKKLTVDISRVRQRRAECDALFAFYCRNFAGFIKLLIPCQGFLDNIEIPYCQELQRIDVDVAENQSDIRFKFFKELSKNENESFVQLHEYAKEGKVAKARALFHRKEKKFMLITERFHFYRRYNIKGVKSLTFYQPPAQSKFYHEMINQVDYNYAHVRLLYTKFDFLRMTHIFGDNCIQQIISSPKTVHVLVSRENE